MSNVQSYPMSKVLDLCKTNILTQLDVSCACTCGGWRRKNLLCCVHPVPERCLEFWHRLAKGKQSSKVGVNYPLAVFQCCTVAVLPCSLSVGHTWKSHARAFPLFIDCLFHPCSLNSVCDCIFERFLLNKQHIHITGFFCVSNEGNWIKIENKLYLPVIN